MNKGIADHKNLIVAKIFMEVVKNPDYKDLFLNGKKKDIYRLVVAKLYELQIYVRPKYKLFKGYQLIPCSREQTERYLTK